MAQAFDPAALMAEMRARNAARGLGRSCSVCKAAVGKFCAMPGQSKDLEFRGSHAERMAS